MLKRTNTILIVSDSTDQRNTQSRWNALLLSQRIGRPVCAAAKMEIVPADDLPRGLAIERTRRGFEQHCARTGSLRLKWRRRLRHLGQWRRWQDPGRGYPREKK